MWQVASIAQCSEAMLGRYELEKAPIPDDVKWRLAKFYGVTRAYLMGWDETGAPNGDDLIPAA